jgi:hypothetical protein
MGPAALSRDESRQWWAFCVRMADDGPMSTERASQITREPVEEMNAFFEKMRSIGFATFDKGAYFPTVSGWRAAGYGTDRSARERSAMTLSELAAELNEAVSKAPEGEIVVSIHLFGIRRAKDLDGVSLKDLVKAARIPQSYHTEIHKGMRLAEYVRII